MSSQYADEVPFETKFSNFREEVLSFGVPINAPINIQKLLEILDSKIVDKQFGRDIVGSIHNYIDKTMQPNFTLAQFFDACLRFRKAFNEKVETVQIELAKLQNERGEAEKALNKVKQFQQEDSHADKHNKILNLEVNGLQGLDLPNSSSVFAKLSCYNIRFITAPKQYTDQVSWKDKFPFEIQTGFERVDVTILAAPTTPQGKEEIIGVAQVHVSGIKDPKYSNEWANLYNGWSLTPVGRVKLGLEIMSSKVGYLERIIQKLDENIAMQIAEIEECEKKLKGFNGLILPPRASYCSSPAKMRQGFVSPTRRTLSDRNSIRVDASPEKCRTILEEEDGESSINSSLDILRLPELNVNYNSTPNPKLQPVESFRDLRSPSNKKESLTRLSERGAQNSNFSRPSEKKDQAPQRLVVYSQEGEIRARSPFPVRQKSEPNVVSVLTKESLNTNSSLETQSHSHSINSEFLKNMLNASDSSDKDAVINYLQKKLNEATRENEHLNNFIVGLTNENQKLKAENAKIPEFENLIQDYEDKICMLLEEVQKLDQLANQRRNENYAELQETRVLKSSLNQARYNNEYEVNKRTLNENIKMVHTLPFNKTPEILGWPQISYENHSPFQSPREMGGLGDSINKTQSSSGNSQTDIEKSRRVREPVKIFPDQRNGSVRRKEFVRPAY